jgi:hypothetical protein
MNEMNENNHPNGRKRGSYTQADRLARMMRTLASRAVTINELAADFGITRRQVYRDLAELKQKDIRSNRLTVLASRHGDCLWAPRGPE